MIIALGNNENYIASDVPAILNETNKYVLLDNFDIAVINKSDIKIYDNNLNEKVMMLKCLKEQKRVL